MPSNSPFATNDHNIATPLFDYSKFPSQGKNFTKVYHGLSIVANDKIIGRIQSWTPTQRNRTVTPKYELNHQTFGRPVDNVPGRAEGYTISMTRTEVWNQELELALGYGNVFSDLMDMNFPFELHEYLYREASAPNRHWIYPMCWLTQLNEDAMDASGGDGAVNVNAEIMHLPRRLVK